LHWVYSSEQWRRKGGHLMFEALLILQKTELQKRREKKQNKKRPNLNMPCAPHEDSPRGQRKTNKVFSILDVLTSFCQTA